jgi:hypothetical protein
MYSAVFESVAVTAAQDLFEIVAPSDAALRIHSFSLGQSSDAGDAESEQLNVLVHRGSTSGSGGTTVTPSPLSLGDAAFGGTVEANNTTQSTEGTFLDARCFNVMAGLEVIYTPESWIEVSPGGRLIIELQNAPADSLTMNGRVVFEEIGG